MARFENKKLIVPRRTTSFSKIQLEPDSTAERVHQSVSIMPSPSYHSQSEHSKSPYAFPSIGTPEPKAVVSSYQSTTTLPHLGMGGFYFNGHHLGGISSDQGVPFFSREGRNWIYEQTGSAPKLSNPHPINPSTIIEGTWDMPSKAIVKTYLDIFRTSARGLVFPIIDEASFNGTIEKAYAYDRDQRSPGVICAKACVLSFTCVMVHMDGELDTPHTVKAEQCAARAVRMMPEILTRPSIESLQVCAMLVWSRQLALVG